MSTPLHLPEVFADLDLKFAKALNTAVPALWPEKVKYQKAEQPEAIGQVLRRTETFDRLGAAHLCFLFREVIETAGRTVLSQTTKAGGKLQHLTGLDFVLEFNHTAWLTLTPEQKLACVDHALAGCWRDLDSGAWQLKAPDVEEFSEVVARWGLWTMPLRGFGLAVERAQFDLFPQPAAAS